MKPGEKCIGPFGRAADNVECQKCNRKPRRKDGNPPKNMKCPFDSCSGSGTGYHPPTLPKPKIYTSGKRPTY